MGANESREGKGPKKVQSLKFHSVGAQGWTCSEGRSSWPPGVSRQSSKLSRHFGLVVSEDHAGYSPDVNPMQGMNARDSLQASMVHWNKSSHLAHTTCLSGTALTYSCLHSASGVSPVPSG